MQEKRFTIELVVTDNQTKASYSRVFHAKREMGGWKQVFEECLRKFNSPPRVMTFLCKRYDLGYGYLKVRNLTDLLMGTEDSDLLKED